MATLSFEAETHQELVRKVRRWLASVDSGAPEGQLSPTDVITQGADLTKEALRVIAQASPAPVADSDIVKSLTALGYRATDTTRDALIEGLDALEALTGGSMVSRAGEASRKAAYQMNQAMAKQFLKTLTGGK